ncbi:MAG: sigma-54 dependent transcriptional regulator, partial [Thermodesulfobacteriota bacterium]
MRPRVLIVDDEPYMLELIETILGQKDSFETLTVSDPFQVMPLLDRETYHLVLLDLKMPGLSGQELLKRIKEHHPHTAVVMVTAYGTIPVAVEAMQTGAADFLTKPFNKKELLRVVEKVLRWQELERENLTLKQALAEKYDFRYLAGDGPAITKVREDARNLAQTSAPLHLSGEIGTGKSYLAKAIHYHSPRNGGPFVDFTVSTVPAEQLAAVIFGQAPGGREQGPGLLGQAEGGTLYLADVPALPLALQKRLVRLIEEGEYEPEGSLLARRADTRLIFSSETPLGQPDRPGSLDPRFLLCLQKFPLNLPPLRRRREDIPGLARSFLHAFGKMYGKEVRDLEDEALAWLVSQDWPGNLREMENTVERAVVLAQGPLLGLADLRPAGREVPFSFSVNPDVFEMPHQEALETSLARFQQALEARYLSHWLQKYAGDLERTAARLGLSAAVLRKKLARMNLDPTR